MAQATLRTTLTYREYCLIPDDGRRHEIVGGKHRMTPAPRPKHQEVLKRAFRMLFVHFEEGGRGKVYFAPLDVILTDEDVMQPDLVVVTELRQISERGIEGPPALVAEILSPSNPEYERTVKAERYAALGVPHYWIADPEARTLECYRNEDGRFVLMVMGKDQDTLTHPDFPGLTIPLASLWPS